MFGISDKTRRLEEIDILKATEDLCDNTMIKMPLLWQERSCLKIEI